MISQMWKQKINEALNVKLTVSEVPSVLRKFKCLSKKADIGNHAYRMYMYKEE